MRYAFNEYHMTRLVAALCAHLHLPQQTVRMVIAPFSVVAQVLIVSTLPSAPTFYNIAF